MRRQIITGCGRSGTGFMSRVLSSCGIPCGHESVFTPTRARPWGRYLADSSWYAAAYLDARALLDVDSKIIHLVRHPHACARSFLGIGFFRTPPPPERRNSHALIRRTSPGILNHATELDRFVSYWILWNRLVDKHADRRIRLEDVSVDSIVDAVDPACSREQIQQAITKHKGYNARARAEVNLKRSSLFDDLRHAARTYGYEL